MKARLAPWRLTPQGLAGRPFTSAAEAVGHLTAVQSQLHDMALWGLARRSTGLTVASVAAEFDAGTFLRTHLLRPTWHHVLPADIGWLLDLTAPRLELALATSNRQIGLDDRAMAASADVIAAAVAETPVTRSELATSLAEAGIEVIDGQQLAHHVMHAEIRQLICSGPMRGKQHTYVAWDSRVPAHDPAGRDELLARAARAYGRGHGPFRDVDLAWWTSLTLTDARRAIELADLVPLEADGVTHWCVEPPVEAGVPPVMLLPNFDELISYARDPDDYAGLTRGRDIVMRSSGLVFVRGTLAGLWTRTLKARRVDVRVTIEPGTRFSRRALEAEAEAFGAFVELPVDLHVEA